MKKTFKKQQTGIGELRTPVFFYKVSNFGPRPTDKGMEELLFTCYAEVYNPSMKDLEILRTIEVKSGVTIKIRDPLLDYFPENTHLVRIEDRRYKDVLWQIIDIRPDFDFITLTLGVVQ